MRLRRKDDGGGDDDWKDAEAYDGHDDHYSATAGSEGLSPTITSPPDSAPTGWREEDILTILYSFGNGDVLVAIDTWTDRICTPYDTMPVASQTYHYEIAAQVTSRLDLSKYPPKYTDRSTPKATSTPSSSSSFDASGWPETETSETPHKTVAQKSSTVPGYGYVSPTPTDQAQNQPFKDHPNRPHHIPIGAIVAIPLVLIGVAVIFFFTWRHKRRQRRQQAGVTQEMKMRESSESGLPQYSFTSASAAPATAATAAPLIPPPSNLSRNNNNSSPQSPSGTGTPSNADDSANTDSSQPVILNNNIGGAYLTGLDTSDAVSVNSNATRNNRMSLDARSMNSSDDPPPPYRPRSVPPISRETSLRIPNGHTQTISLSQLAPLSESNFSRARVNEGSGLNNPFADPESDGDDDDFASERSSIVSPLVGGEGGISRNGNSNPAMPSRQV